MSQTAICTPNKGPVGTGTNISGAGWAPNEYISLATIGGVTIVDPIWVDGDGLMTTPTIEIPELTHGPKDLVLTGNTNGEKTFPNAFVVTIQGNSLGKSYPASGTQNSLNDAYPAPEGATHNSLNNIYPT
jgi:hypothetical protein